MSPLIRHPIFLFPFHFLMLSISPQINSFFSFASVALVRPDQPLGTDPDPSRSIRSYQTITAVTTAWEFFLPGLERNRKSSAHFFDFSRANVSFIR